MCGALGSMRLLADRRVGFGVDFKCNWGLQRYIRAELYCVARAHCAVWNGFMLALHSVSVLLASAAELEQIYSWQAFSDVSALSVVCSGPAAPSVVLCLLVPSDFPWLIVRNAVAPAQMQCLYQRDQQQ
jgi:hypothetical protein